MRLAEKQRLLESVDVGNRLELLVGLVDGEIDVQQLEKRIRGRVKSQMVVVVRSGAQLAPVVRALAMAEVPARTTAAGTALREDFAARSLLRLCLLYTSRCV